MSFTFAVAVTVPVMDNGQRYGRGDGPTHNFGNDFSYGYIYDYGYGYGYDYDFGNDFSYGYRGWGRGGTTSGLSIPIPKAMVAQMTFTSPPLHIRCTADLSRLPIPAW